MHNFYTMLFLIRKINIFLKSLIFKVLLLLLLLLLAGVGRMKLIRETTVLEREGGKLNDS